MFVLLNYTYLRQVFWNKLSHQKNNVTKSGFAIDIKYKYMLKCDSMNTVKLQTVVKSRYVKSGLFGLFLSVSQPHIRAFNTSYLTDSYVSFTLKLESRQKFCYNSLIRSSTYGKKKYFWFSSMREDGCFCYWILIFLKTSK